MKQAALVLGGAVLGGVVGYFGFGWLIRQGFYGLVLPGGLIGLGAGVASCRSRWPAVVCGISALLLGLFTEWSYFPFKADGSFGYFLCNAHDLKPLTLMMIAAGAAIGFWVPFRRVDLEGERSAPTSA
jgi:hypothetical protein